MKRKTNLPPNRSAKHPRTSDSSNASTFKDAESSRVQAEPYRLTTVKFPINALTPTWSIGKNRPVDCKHVQTLCRIFMQNGGVERKSWDNRLLILCTQQEVEKMMRHIRVDGSNSASPELPLFNDWIAVNGEKAELMAGQHRADALREYVRRTGSGDDELWWVCDLYDKDTLPRHLNIKLRVNRHDSTLQDTHGQIWRQLATTSAMDETLFQGTNSAIEREMLEALGLGGPVKFPIRRLVTLWKNANWRAMITRWCETTLGQATFTISTWEWMASCRMDDYWFATFEDVLNVVSQLSDGSPECITPADWIKLAGLPRNRTTKDVQELFHPSREGSTAVDCLRSRRDGFLTMLGDEAYQRAYELVATSAGIYFPDVHGLLKTTKDEGRIMMRVMSHVVQWLNSDPTKVGDRENNKPSLRKDFLPALTDYWGDKTEERSLILERRVVDFVRGHVAQFKNPATEAYLTQFPADSSDSYSERFTDRAWKSVLEIVRDVTGPSFPTNTILSLGRGNCDEAAPKTTSSIAEAMCALTDRIPEIAQNPALNNKWALNALCSRLDPLVVEWAAQHCRDALHAQSNDDTIAWSASTVQQVESARDRYENQAKSLPSTARLNQENRDGSPGVVPCTFPAVCPVEGTASPYIVGEGTDGSSRNRASKCQERAHEQGNAGGKMVAADGGHSERRKDPDLREITAEDLAGMRKLHRQSKSGPHRTPFRPPLHGHGEDNPEKSGSIMPRPTVARRTTHRAGSSWRRDPAAQSSSTAREWQ